MLRVKDLSFSFGNQVIYNPSSFVVNAGQKVGLVGANGSGKSTLFRLLMGKHSPDTGTVELDERLSFVPQEVSREDPLDHAPTIREYICKNQLFPDYEISRFLAGLQLSSLSLEQDPSHLSGGQKTRLAIIRALLEEPELLLLDEPTNFIDKEGRYWILNELAHYRKTLILVSHDLRFLDDVINKVLFINHQTRTIDTYQGNYTAFLRQKKEREDLLVRQIKVQEKQIIRMRESLTKIGGRSEKGARRKIQLERRLERIIESLPDLPQEARKIKITLPPPAHSGQIPLLTKNITKSFGAKQVLTGVTLTLKRGERTALLGPNGVGKSTLIKILTQNLDADSGEVIRDYNLKIGYYSQEFENFDVSKKVIDAVREKTNLGESQIRPMLFRMLFTYDKLFQPIATLSGGEKTRLAIATLLLQDFNLLILDEPTTYLDVMSQRLILEGLRQYTGSLLIVSHNPEFIDGLAVHQKYHLPEHRLELCRL